MQAGFSYAQTRCQARFALLWREQWARLEAEGDAAVFLAAVQQRPFDRMLANLPGSAGAHEVDAFGRELFRRITIETGKWVPARWRPAVHWVTELAELPALEYLDRGGTAYPWMREDERLPPPRPDGTGSAAGPGDAWRRGAEPSRPLYEAWLEHWRQLWPHTDAATRRGLHAVEQAVLAGRPVSGAPAAARDTAARLEHELLGIFRRTAGAPAAVFAYLGLVWLEIARLRGGLLARKLFPASG